MYQDTTRSVGVAASPEKHRHRPTKRAVRRLLWWIGWLPVVLAPIATGYDYMLPTILVGRTVIAGLHAVELLLVGGVCCWVACFVLWISEDRMIRHSTWQVATATGVVAILGLVAAALFGFLCWRTLPAYHLLGPASPSGCQLVVAEWRSFSGVSNRVYLVAPGSPILQRTDAGRSVGLGSDGTWTLSWDGTAADLNVGGQQLENANGPIRCPQ